MAEITRSLTVLVHGPSKAGKSSLAATAPKPLLYLDVEHGHKFLSNLGRVRYWDPKAETVPEFDGSWDTVVVPVLTYADMESSFKYLKLGQHSFRSVILDSVSELQVKLIDQLVGTEQVKMQTWGVLLRSLGDMMRGLRDLTMHPTNPLEAVVITSMSQVDQTSVAHPYLQGQLKTQLPYLYDILGYIRMEEWPNPDPTQPPYKLRRMYIETTNFAEAGERVQGRLGAIVEQPDLDIQKMIDKVYGPEVPAVATEGAVNG